MEVSLSEDHHHQMCNIVEKVIKLGAEELESSLEESDKNGVGAALRAIWEIDLENIKKKNFDKDKQKNSEFFTDTHTHTHSPPFLPPPSLSTAHTHF